MGSVMMASTRNAVAHGQLHDDAHMRAMAFQRFKVKRHGQRPLVFEGALLVEHALPLSETIRQTVRIWETAGALVLQIEQTRRSEDDEDRSGRSFVHVCDSVDAVRTALDQFDPSHALSDHMARLLTCPSAEAESETKAYAEALQSVDTQNRALMQAFST